MSEARPAKKPLAVRWLEGVANQPMPLSLPGKLVGHPTSAAVSHARRCCWWAQPFSCTNAAAGAAVGTAVALLAAVALLLEPKWLRQLLEPKWLIAGPIGWKFANGDLQQFRPRWLPGSRQSQIFLWVCGPALRTPCCPISARARLVWQLHGAGLSPPCPLAAPYPHLQLPPVGVPPLTQAIFFWP